MFNEKIMFHFTPSNIWWWNLTIVVHIHHSSSRTFGRSLLGANLLLQCFLFIFLAKGLGVWMLCWYILTIPILFLKVLLMFFFGCWMRPNYTAITFFDTVDARDMANQLTCSKISHHLEGFHVLWDSTFGSPDETLVNKPLSHSFWSDFTTGASLTSAAWYTLITWCFNLQITFFFTDPSLLQTYLPVLSTWTPPWDNPSPPPKKWRALGRIQERSI